MVEPREPVRGSRHLTWIDYLFSLAGVIFHHHLLTSKEIGFIHGTLHRELS